MNNNEEDDPLDQEIDFTKVKVDWERTNKLRARAREAIEKGEKPTRIIIEDMDNNDKYSELLAAHHPRVIRDETEHDRQLAIIADLVKRMNKLTPEEDALLDLLSVLDVAYEEGHYHIEGRELEQGEDYEQDVARFRWIMDHQKTYAEMTQRFAGEALIGLIDNEIKFIGERGEEDESN